MPDTTATGLKATFDQECGQLRKLADNAQARLTQSPGFDARVRRLAGDAAAFVHQQGRFSPEGRRVLEEVEKADRTLKAFKRSQESLDAIGRLESVLQEQQQEALAKSMFVPPPDERMQYDRDASNVSFLTMGTRAPTRSRPATTPADLLRRAQRVGMGAVAARVLSRGRR